MHFIERSLLSKRTCQVHNNGPVLNKDPLVPIVATRPSQIVSLDFVGPLKTSRNGNKFFIFGLDKFTKLYKHRVRRTLQLRLRRCFYTTNGYVGMAQSKPF
jgi:hypothetical protein